MNSKKFFVGRAIGFIVVLVLVLVGFMLFRSVPESVLTVLAPSVGAITIQGRMVCLPHKNTDGPQTLECAFGLKDDEGRYFALSDTDSAYKNIGNVPMNVRVEVEGVFALRTDSNYQDIGVISVTRVTQISSGEPVAN